MSDHKYDIPGSNAAMRMHLDEAHGIPWDDTENNDYARNIALHVEFHKTTEQKEEEARRAAMDEEKRQRVRDAVQHMDNEQLARQIASASYSFNDEQHVLVSEAVRRLLDKG